MKPSGRPKVATTVIRQFVMPQNRFALQYSPDSVYLSAILDICKRLYSDPIICTHGMDYFPTAYIHCYMAIVITDYQVACFYILQRHCFSHFRLRIYAVIHIHAGFSIGLHCQSTAVRCLILCSAPNISSAVHACGIINGCFYSCFSLRCTIHTFSYLDVLTLMITFIDKDIICSADILALTCHTLIFIGSESTRHSHRGFFFEDFLNLPFLKL